jgi:hypothetical protein
MRIVTLSRLVLIVGRTHIISVYSEKKESNVIVSSSVSCNVDSFEIYF